MCLNRYPHHYFQIRWYLKLLILLSLRSILKAPSIVLIFFLLIVYAGVVVQLFMIINFQAIFDVLWWCNLVLTSNENYCINTLEIPCTRSKKMNKREDKRVLCTYKKIIETYRNIIKTEIVLSSIQVYNDETFATYKHPGYMLPPSSFLLTVE